MIEDLAKIYDIRVTACLLLDDDKYNLINAQQKKINTVSAECFNFKVVKDEQFDNQEFVDENLARI